MLRNIQKLFGHKLSNLIQAGCYIELLVDCKLPVNFRDFLLNFCETAE